MAIDLAISASAGVVISLVLVIYFSGTPKEPKADEKEPTTELKDEEEPASIKFDNEAFIRRTKGIQEKFGINEDQLRKELNEDKTLDEPISWVKMLDWLIFLIVIGVLIYFLNDFTDGDFARVIVAFFPREFEALGLKEYFERVHRVESFPPAVNSFHQEL